MGLDLFAEKDPQKSLLSRCEKLFMKYARVAEQNGCELVPDYSPMGGRNLRG
jgi:hypothetical protein